MSTFSHLFCQRPLIDLVTGRTHYSLSSVSSLPSISFARVFFLCPPPPPSFYLCPNCLNTSMLISGSSPLFCSPALPAGPIQSTDFLGFVLRAVMFHHLGTMFSVSSHELHLDSQNRKLGWARQSASNCPCDCFALTVRTSEPGSSSSFILICL